MTKKRCNKSEMTFRNSSSAGSISGKLTLILLLAWAIGLCGCSPPAEFRTNSVHVLVIEKSMLPEGETIGKDQFQQLGNVVTAMFGTPDEPWFPDFMPDDDAAASVVDATLLSAAAGPVSSDRHGEPQGLYREHCAHCHGISGDGAGPTASLLNPYPRDFRLGKFKFKATKIGKPPTDADLEHIIRNGIPGTAMPSFQLLSAEEIASLINYVKYLSIRGQVERRLIEELPNLEATALLPAKSAAPDEYADSLAFILEDHFLDIVDRWSPQRNRPPDIPSLPNQFLEKRPELAIEGKLLFFGKGNCVQLPWANGNG